MAIFVNRHLISDEITAERLAEFHLADLKIQEKFRCKALSWWFDEDKKIAFYLVDAPDAASIMKMHELNHENIPNKIIKVNETIIEAFIQRIERSLSAEISDSNILNQSVFKTLLIGEIKSFSLNNYRSETIVNLYRDFYQTIPTILNEFNGRLNFYQGECFIASFNTVSCAVGGARSIREFFISITDNLENCGLQIKLSLRAGEIDISDSSFERTLKLSKRFGYIDKNVINMTAEVRESYRSENFGAFINENEIFAFTPGDEKFFNHLMDYIEKEYSNPDLKADDFSRNMGYSKSQLYRKMITVTGNNPNTFIKKYRLEKAFHLLSRKKGNINQIAFDTGFNSPGYFSKCFEETYGILPSFYIKEKI